MADNPPLYDPQKRPTGALAAALRAQERGELTEAQIDRAIQHLVEMWGPDRPCPYCGNVTWNVGGDLLEVDFYGRPRRLPMLGVECDRCGNTVLLNAHTAGLLDDEAQ